MPRSMFDEKGELVPDDAWLTTAEVVELTNVSRHTLLAWNRREDGPLSAHKVGPRMLLWKRSDVVKLLRRR